MHIAIIGTRGIPNHYGGFEQCAEYLALGLVKNGYTVTVYNSHNHPNQQSVWEGVHIIHRHDPEYKLGAAGQFIYDYNCIVDARKRNFDIILQLGYTSNSIWGWMLPSKAIVTTNMDGLEWKRTKFSYLSKKFLLLAESLAVKFSDHLISDSIGIQNYLFTKYQKKSVFIPYGADLVYNYDLEILREYGLKAYEYDMLVARLEPENSIEVILDGVIKSALNMPFLVVGKHDTSYGNYLKSRYFKNKNVCFVGGIYDINKLNSLRHYSKLYFHGHTVGGTNPSLLEAMASDCLICANDNPFNNYILDKDALYFENADQIAIHLQTVNHADENFTQMIENNRLKIKNVYSWDNILNQYIAHFEAIINCKGVIKVFA